MRTQYTNNGAFIGSTQSAPTFQLPFPPPGMQWHTDKDWKDGDLPQGWRPLAYLEQPQQGDEQKTESGWMLQTAKGITLLPTEAQQLQRTRRPLTFTHAGKQWTWHRPGDPRPVLARTMVHMLMRDNDFSSHPSRAGNYEWGQIDGVYGSMAEIIGWRYADETKTAPLGPEDVRCGDEIQMVTGDNRLILRVTEKAVEIHGLGSVTFFELQLCKSARIRRRNSDEWKPCSKEVLA